MEDEDADFKATDRVKHLIDVLRSNKANNEKKRFLLTFLEVSHQINSQNVDKELINELFEGLFAFGSVPSIADGQERELDEKDFDGVSGHAFVSLRCYELFLNERKETVNLIPCLILCAQHASDRNLWTNSDCLIKSKQIIEMILLKRKVSDIQSLLLEGINLSKLFASFRPFLTRNDWKRNPGMKEAFVWYLFHLKHPIVEHVLNDVLPPSLLFIDDFVVSNRYVGIECCLHIMENTPSAELKRYGRAEVIYDALNKLIYTRESQLVSAVFPCLLKVLEVVEIDPSKPAQIRKVNRYDMLFQHILQEMDMEQTISLRVAYSKLLDPFIRKLSITVVRQMKTTVRILLQYFEVYDDLEENTRRNCLLALRTLISIAWPRITDYMSDIIKALVRLLYDINESRSASCEVKDAVVGDCIKCLKLLRKLKPEYFDSKTKPLLNVASEISGLAALKSVWDDP